MENKKLAAAMAAVHMYIKTKEEAAIAMHNQAAVEAAAQPPVGPINLWGLSGRQTIMNNNALVRQRISK